MENLVRAVLLEKDGDPILRLSDLPTDLLQTLQLADDNEPPIHIRVRSSRDSDPLLRLFEQHGWSLEPCLAHCERVLVDAAMQRARGNQSAAARMLGITPRTMYNKLRKHGFVG